MYKECQHVKMEQYTSAVFLLLIHWQQKKTIMYVVQSMYRNVNFLKIFSTQCKLQVMVKDIKQQQKTINTAKHTYSTYITKSSTMLIYYGEKHLIWPENIGYQQKMAFFRSPVKQFTNFLWRNLKFDTQISNKSNSNVNSKQKQNHKQYTCHLASAKD